MHFVNDILLVSPNAKICLRDSKILLIELYKRGHIISKAKLQWVLPWVKYLGFVLSEGSRSITQKRRADIQSLSAPKTNKKQLRAILGTTGFCRQWIPAYSEIMKCLTDLIRNTEPEPLKLKRKHRVALTRLKEDILSASVFGILGYEKLFSYLSTRLKV